MRLHVAVGQEWEISLNNFGSRVRIRIVSIEGSTAMAIIVLSGKPMGISVRTLEPGNRGARIVLEADGTVPYEPPPISKRVMGPKHELTASDYRRPLKGPRGVVRGGQLSETQEKIEKLVADGFTSAEIGRRLGIKRDSVDRHREAILNFRAFKTMEESG